MVNNEVKKSLEKKYFTRTTLAKRLKKQVSAIERMLYRQVITPDAWVVDRSQSHPLFDVTRLEEIKVAIDAYFAKMEEARADQVEVSV